MNTISKKYFLLVMAAMGLLLVLFNNCSDAGLLKGVGDLQSVDDEVDEGDPVEFGSNFFEGTYDNTFGIPNFGYLRTVDAASSAEGTYESPVIDAEESIRWSQLGWVPGAPYNKPLPAGQQSEIAYPYGSLDMTSNILLYRFNSADNNSFQDSSGGTSVDHIGNCQSTTCPGVIEDSPFEEGRSAEFSNLADDFIRIEHSDEFLAEEGTILMWVKIADNENGIFTLISKDADGLGAGGHLRVELHPGNLLANGNRLGRSVHFTLGDDVQDTTLISAFPIANNVWTRVMVSWGPAGMQIYSAFVNQFVPGIAASNAFTGGLQANTEPLIVGASNALSTPGNQVLENHFRGALDELAIFNRQLSATEAAGMLSRVGANLSLQVRSCALPDCSDSEYSSSISEALNESGDLPIFNIREITPPNRYFQYRVYLQNDRGGISPILRQVTIGGFR